MFAASRILRASGQGIVQQAKGAVQEAGSGQQGMLKKGARKDPELYV